MHTIPASLVILNCVACIRCKHLAISSLKSHDSSRITAFCPKGKRVRKGTRPPYSWAVPLLPEIPASLFKFLTDIITRWETPPFVVPAFQAGTTRRKFVARKWLQKPMLNHQWVTLLRQVMAAAGWAQPLLSTLSFNSMRRFLPTLADVLRCDRDTAQAVGSWQEVPQGEGCAGRAIRPMSLHYSDEQALSSCVAKAKVLTRFFEVAALHPQAAAVLAGSLPALEAFAFDWKVFASLAHPNPPTRPLTSHHHLLHLRQHCPSSLPAGRSPSWTHSIRRTRRTRRRRRERTRRARKRRRTRAPRSSPSVTHTRDSARSHRTTPELQWSACLDV